VRIRPGPGILFLLPLIIFGACGAALAQTSPQAPECSPRMLDMRIVLGPDAQESSAAYWLALEFTNRDAQTCLLIEPYVTSPVDQEQQLGGWWEKDDSPSAAKFRASSDRLTQGESAHIFIAWSSVPIVVSGIAMDDCVMRDDIFAGWHLPNVDLKDPLLHVRHLSMKSCDTIWRSSLRAGPYVPGEAIPQGWLDRVHLKATDFLPPLPSVASRGDATGPRSAVLRSMSDVEYLPASFESGYSGYFELLLHVGLTHDLSCSFRTLREREANGQTEIYVNHCEGHGAQQQSADNVTRIIVRSFEMTPTHTGRAEFESDSEVFQGGQTLSARSSAEISVRDPNRPELPAIDSGGPRCEANQLAPAGPPVDLGTHWAQSAAYPPIGQEWLDGRVFEFKNISSQSCWLGGTPSLKFLEPVEVTSGSLLPPVCRNCATPLFNPRENHWIELKPNDSAHFIVVRDLLDSNFWPLCTLMGGIDLFPKSPDPIHLSFRAGFCGQVRVSAWRDGPYDNDPLNEKYDQTLATLEKQRATANPLPKNWTAEISRDSGTPVILLSQGPLRWGISTRPVHDGEPVSVLLWIENTTDQPQATMTCAGIDFFWLYGIDVFDSLGHRVLSLTEEKEKKLPADKPLPQWIPMCTRNFRIQIPPHTIMHGTFSSLPYDFSRDLAAYYSLPPGRYIVVPAKRGQDYRPVARTLSDFSSGLWVTVLDP